MEFSAGFALLSTVFEEYRRESRIFGAGIIFGIFFGCAMLVLRQRDKAHKT